MKLLLHFRILTSISIIALAAGSLLAQSHSGTAPPVGGYRSPSEDPDVGRRGNDRHLEDSQRRIDEMGIRQGSMNNTSLPRNGRPVFVYKSEGKLNAKERMLLATHPDDQKKYAEFLRQPGTGLFRLLPSESKGVVTVDTLKSGGGILPMKGGGAYYSYSKLRHDMDGWSQIALLNETFQVGVADKSLGLMGLLGDVNLEAITLASKEVNYLHKLVPPSTYEEMITQIDNNIRRLNADGIIYSSIIAPRADNTYVLRSTTYGKADLLVAFRVIREDADGSLHILWKKLADYPVPRLSGTPRK